MGGGESSGLVVADELARACVVAAALLPGLLLAAKREVLQAFRRLAIPRGKMKEPRGKTKQGKMKEPKKYPLSARTGRLVTTPAMTRTPRMGLPRESVIRSSPRKRALDASDEDD